VRALGRLSAAVGFAPWVPWRTIRATLAHIADAETHYHPCNRGCEPEGAQIDTSRAFATQARNATR